MELLGWLLIVVGLTMIGLVMYKWNWCMKSSRVRSIAKYLKEPGARIFYVIVGFALLTIGGLLVTDVW
jgi:hypothetical protein